MAALRSMALHQNMWSCQKHIALSSFTETQQNSPEHHFSKKPVRTALVLLDLAEPLSLWIHRTLLLLFSGYQASISLLLLQRLKATSPENGKNTQLRS